MNILHVTLGIPELRSGGLIRYSYDLAKAQSQSGHKVYMIYPGKINLLRKDTRILPYKKESNLRIYKLVNPVYVPVPLGVSDPQSIMVNLESDIYGKFLDRIKPDLVHIHTFMGFHLLFFQEIAKRKIKTVYTTHDYYVLCPKTSLINEKMENCTGCSPKKCAICNSNIHQSMIRQYILQSEWYPRIKRSKLVSYMKKKRKGDRKKDNEIKPFVSDKKETRNIDRDTIRLYGQLLEYLRKMLSYVDIIHCNSTVTFDIYSKYFPPENMFVESITIDGLEDHRNPANIMKARSGKLRIGFIGIRDRHKGYWLLCEAGKILEKHNTSFEMLFYGDEYDIPLETYPFCVEKGRFNHDELTFIMSEMDILVVPGLWYETFGFTSIEALANNVVVLISDHTGSKDVFENVMTPHVFEPTPESLAHLLQKYLSDRSLLDRALKEQAECCVDFSVSEHSKKFLNRLGRENFHGKREEVTGTRGAEMLLE